MESVEKNSGPLKIFLETHGCQMNVYDSELVWSILESQGHERCTSLPEAEVVLLNTCAVRENAFQKIYGRLDSFRPLKKSRKRLVVGVLGCMAQNLKEELFEHPVVSLVVGPDNYRALPYLIGRVLVTDGREIDADLSEYETYSDIAPARVEGVNAWVAVMRGCDNFCTFCVVPYTRGRERSRPVQGILDEVRSLSEKGFKQVTLLGQNVNSYHDGGATFADLMVRVAEIRGIERVRFISPHPKDFPEPLLEAVADHPNICKHIHLPLQAGSDRILNLMNRTYTRKEYLDLVDRIRTRIPGVSLTTDIIVGFPTENENDFMETHGVMQQVGFDNSFIFKYSERKKTIAARNFPDDISPEIKTERIVRLVELQREISYRKNKAKIGTRLPVLLEGNSEKRPDYQTGKSDGNVTVNFPATQFRPGSIVTIEIRDASPNVLYGVSVNSHPAVSSSGGRREGSLAGSR